MLAWATLKQCGLLISFTLHPTSVTQSTSPTQYQPFELSLEAKENKTKDNRVGQDFKAWVRAGLPLPTPLSLQEMGKYLQEAQSKGLVMWEHEPGVAMGEKKGGEAPRRRCAGEITLSPFFLILKCRLNLPALSHIDVSFGGEMVVLNFCL